MNDPAVNTPVAGALIVTLLWIPSGITGCRVHFCEVFHFAEKILDKSNKTKKVHVCMYLYHFI